MLKFSEYLKVFGSIMAILFIFSLLSGCQRQISQSQASQIAYAQLQESYRHGFFGHKITSAKLKSSESYSNCWIFTYIFKDAPGYSILITVDKYGNVLNVAFGTPKWP